MGKPSWLMARNPFLNTIGEAEPTRGSETSQYPEEEKENSIPSVAASESGIAQTGKLAFRGCRAGVVGLAKRAERSWISATAEGESPVREAEPALSRT